MKLELSVELINQILTYLDQKPHGEVRRLIDSIHLEVEVAQKKAIPQVIPPESIAEATINTK